MSNTSPRLYLMPIPVRRYLEQGRLVGCRKCHTHLTTPDQLMSREFRAANGPASLYRSVINVWEGPSEEREMSTGRHSVKDIYCITCDTCLGWHYVK